MESDTTVSPEPLLSDPSVREIEKATAVIQTEVRGDRKLSEAHFAAIDKEFGLVEDRRKEQKSDTRVAVDAVMATADKAIQEQSSSSEKAIRNLTNKIGGLALYGFMMTVVVIAIVFIMAFK